MLPGMRERRGFLASLAAVILAGAAVVTVFAVMRARGGPQVARPSGIPAIVSDAQINLMGLSPVPAGPAPGFTLTDQNGRTVSLSALRGKVVVLEFMDPHCTDICPMVSQEFVDAYHDLGPLARQGRLRRGQRQPVPRRGVGHAGLLPRAAADHDPRLAFLHRARRRPAGGLARLRHRGPGAQPGRRHRAHLGRVLHRPGGRERYLAEPMADHTTCGAAYLPAGQIAAWGQGIAQVARALAR